MPEEKRAELKGKCHVRGCGKSVLDLRDFNQRYHICGDHIKVCVLCAVGRLPAPARQQSSIGGRRRPCSLHIFCHPYGASTTQILDLVNEFMALQQQGARSIFS